VRSAQVATASGATTVTASSYADVYGWAASGADTTAYQTEVPIGSHAERAVNQVSAGRYPNGRDASSSNRFTRFSLLLQSRDTFCDLPEVSPVRLILIRIPFVGILVSLIFVAPALLIVFAFVVWVATVLGAHQYWHSQGRTQHNHFATVIHDVLPPALSGNTIAIASAEEAPFGQSIQPSRIRAHRERVTRYSDRGDRGGLGSGGFLP
jgi:hypothetical protein